jgi:predicted RNA-binding protein with TRAM domain
MEGYEREGGFDRRPRFVPVQVGEEYEVTIEAVGEKGDGIAKIKGFVIFVPNVKEGDNVKIKVTRVLRKVGFGEVVGAAAPKEASEAAPAEEKSEEAAEPEAEEPAAPDASEDFGEDDSEEEAK